MRTLEQLLEAVQSKVDTPEDRQLVEALTVDLANLGARQLLGEDVSAELAHVEAAAANLAAGKAVEIADEIHLFLCDVVAALVGTILR